MNKSFQKQWLFVLLLTGSFLFSSLVVFAQTKTTITTQPTLKPIQKVQTTTKPSTGQAQIAASKLPKFVFLRKITRKNLPLILEKMSFSPVEAVKVQVDKDQQTSWQIFSVKLKDGRSFVSFKQATAPGAALFKSEVATAAFFNTLLEGLGKLKVEGILDREDKISPEFVEFVVAGLKDDGYELQDIDEDIINTSLRELVLADLSAFDINMKELLIVVDADALMQGVEEAKNMFFELGAVYGGTVIFENAGRTRTYVDPTGVAWPSIVFYDDIKRYDPYSGQTVRLTDPDGDGYYDTTYLSDDDIDNDGVHNDDDSDMDGDGKANWRDRDDDGDGVPDKDDDYPNNPHNNIWSESERWPMLVTKIGGFFNTDEFLNLLRDFDDNLITEAVFNTQMQEMFKVWFQQ